MQNTRSKSTLRVSAAAVVRRGTLCYWQRCLAVNVSKRLNFSIVDWTIFGCCYVTADDSPLCRRGALPTWMNNPEQASPTQRKQGCYEFSDGAVIVRYKRCISWKSVTAAGLDNALQKKDGICSLRTYFLSFSLPPCRVVGGFAKRSISHDDLWNDSCIFTEKNQPHFFIFSFCDISNN